MTDEDLFASFLNGDEGAFNLLYQQYKVRLRRFIESQGTSRENAEDLMQETFCQVYRRAETFDADHRGTNAFRRWLFAIARNRLNSFRRRRGLPLFTGGEEDGTQTVPDPDPDPQDEPELAVLIRRLLACVRRLSATYRELTEMTLQEWSAADIAEILGIPSGTVYSRRSQAVKRLRRCMEGR